MKQLVTIFLFAVCVSFFTLEVEGSPQSSSNHTVTMREPDIFILGMERSATTSLYDVLRTHPSICGKVKKDLNFFNNDVNWVKGYQFYRKFFLPCKADKIFIDATPVFHLNFVADRIGSLYPPKLLHQKKKFILILRENVSRDFSFYLYRLQACYDFLELRDSVEFKSVYAINDIYTMLGERSCISLLSDPEMMKRDISKITFLSFQEYFKKGFLDKSDGDYFKHLKRWLTVIERKQLFILSMETLVTNTTDTLTRLQKFLELPEGWKQSITFPKLNSISHVKGYLDCTTKYDLGVHYSEVNKGLASFIRSSSGKPPAEEPYFVGLRSLPTDELCSDANFEESVGSPIGREYGFKHTVDGPTKGKTSIASTTRTGTGGDINLGSMKGNDSKVVKVGSVASSAERMEEVAPLSMPGADTHLYREIGGVQLLLHVAKPTGWKITDQRAYMLCFFGGGWTSGTPRQMSGWMHWAASNGIVGIAPDYRTRGRHHTMPEDSVDDARAAAIWVQRKAPEFGIDPRLMIALGASAGGHLAIWLAIPNPLSETTYPSERQKIPAHTPKALILLWPVTDTTATGYGGPHRFGDNTKRAQAISVTQNLPNAVPTTMVVHGTADETVSYNNSRAFVSAMRRTGNRAVFVTIENAPHSPTSEKFYPNHTEKVYRVLNLSMHQFLNGLRLL